MSVIFERESSVLWNPDGLLRIDIQIGAQEAHMGEPQDKTVVKNRVISKYWHKMPENAPQRPRPSGDSLRGRTHYQMLIFRDIHPCNDMKK